MNTQARQQRTLKKQSKKTQKHLSLKEKYTTQKPKASSDDADDDHDDEQLQDGDDNDENFQFDDQDEGSSDYNSSSLLLDVNNFFHHKPTFSLDSSSSEQSDLIQRAFAAPDFEQDFDDERQKELDQEEEQKRKKQQKEEESVNLPGWGYWIGEGAPPPRSKQSSSSASSSSTNSSTTSSTSSTTTSSSSLSLATTTSKVQKKPKFKVNQKTDKKFSKYVPTGVPGPAHRHNSRIMLPIGKEWNTAQSYTLLTKPKLAVERGALIEPISKEILSDRVEKHQQDKSAKQNPLPVSVSGKPSAQNKNQNPKAQNRGSQFPKTKPSPKQNPKAQK